MGERPPRPTRGDYVVWRRMTTRWADDDLRSLNGQIEFLLRKALEQSGRQRPKAEEPIAEHKA